MQSISQAVHRYTYDLVDNDPITYTQGSSLAGMLKMINTGKETLADITKQLEPHIPPNTGVDDKVYVYWRLGECMRADKQCDTATYHNDVGYTKDLAKSGLEHQIYKFLETADSYIYEGQYQQATSAPTFQLIKYMNDDFYTFFNQLIESFNQYAADSTIVATAVLFSLATCVFISFDIYYQIGFSRASDKFFQNNRQLICLVFMVSQADRIKNQDLNTFVESSGASVN